ncbi:hypothetical protein HYH03_014803 [Edaphochlamys debaryana]|uniref:Mitochondrial carrier protein n=1 Tax=Edaphochlamys debaryana TaxID=47281 RepID=A0A835XQN6_9CHLO|nr:hypothetical protein HYH03_014803 [Edaphochlamys debaryana]|eukprot:KAG2486501.1 hypothetical protein HYH03_014803 [Edaphochlamys debaryana]
MVPTSLTHASDILRACSGTEASTSGRERLGSDSTSPGATLERDPSATDAALLLVSEETAEAAPLVAHNAIKLAFCGGVSGAVAKTATAPLARLTILYQVQSVAVTGAGGALPTSMTAALRHVVATEGLRSLWRGNLVTIMHRIPYSATNFWAYETTKQMLQGRVRSDMARTWTSGAVAGLVACTAAYPLDLLRTRFAAERGAGDGAGGGGSASARRGVAASLRRIVSEQGVRGLYKGLGATLVQVVPGLAFNFCFYDTFKRIALRHSVPHPHPHMQHHHLRGPQHREQAAGGGQAAPFTAAAGPAAALGAGRRSLGAAAGGGGAPHGSGLGQSGHGGAPDGAGASAAVAAPSPLTSAVCACLAGLCTSTLTFPLDVVRRRLQVYERGALGSMGYADVVRALHAEGGGAAFYRGILPEYAKVLPGMAIAFTSYEALKRFTGAVSSA